MSRWNTHIFIASALWISVSVSSQAAAQEPAASDTGEASEELEESYFPEMMEEREPVRVLENALAVELQLSLAAHQERARAVFQLAGAWEKGATLAFCFASGTSDMRRRVAAIANEWNFEGSPFILDFGDLSDPRSCGGSSQHITVDIDAGPSWSQIGQYTRSSGMVLGLESDLANSAAKFRQIVLHEFGHALGLRHELKHASGQCWDEFEPGALKAFYSKTFKFDEEERIRAAIGTFDSREMDDGFVFTAFDSKSVMMYSFPAEVYRHGKKSRCWAPLNDRLSESDKATLKLAHQSPLVAASTLASMSADKGVEAIQLANAYNSLLLSTGDKRQRLMDAAAALPAGVSPTEIAAAVLSASEDLSIKEFGRR